MKHKVFIVGANGFIGLHAVKYLSQKGFSVVGHHVSGETLPQVPGVTWIPGDLVDPNVTHDWPKDCDSVMYLAQSPYWRAFPEYATNIMEVNAAAAVRTIAHAQKVGAERFIFTSSGSVYTPNNKPLLENESIDFTKAQSFYGASKQAAELLLGPFSDHMSVIILRLFMPYGAGQNPAMLLPQLVHRVEDDLPIDLQGADGMKINPIAIADVNEVLARCIKQNQSITMNVAGPEVLTLREIGVQIGEVLGKKARFNSNVDQSAPMLVGDITRLIQTLDWTPQTLFKDGLASWLKATSME